MGEEKRVAEELISVMRVLGELFPPGIGEILVIDSEVYTQIKSKTELTLKPYVYNLFKLIYYKSRSVFMKKYFTILILFMSIASFAALITTTATPEQEQSVGSVKDFPGVKKDVLYDKSLSYLTRHYNSVNDVIQLKDKQNGQIICKGLGNIKNFGMKYYFNYTLIVDIKDNKVRTKFENINGNNVPPSGTLNIGSYWKEISVSCKKIRDDYYDSISKTKVDDNW